MERFILILLAMITINEAYTPKIKVYEIRKVKDHGLDDQYYDPSNFKAGYKIPQDNGLEQLVADIIGRLNHLNKRDRDERVFGSSDSEDSDDVFQDDTRSLPVILVPDKKLVQRKPKTKDLLRKLWNSVLRTGVEDDVEDRTAAPRIRDHFDY